MQLDKILNELQANSGLVQVVNPAIVQVQSVDSAKVLKSIVRPLVSGGCYPDIIPEKTTYPAAAYEPTGSNRWGDEEFEMFSTETFVLTLYDKSLAELMPLVEQVKTALMGYGSAGEFASIELVNVAIGYDDVRDYRVAGIELEITYLAQPLQTAPMAYVYYNGVTAQDSQTLDVTRQQAQYSFNVTLVCLYSELESTRKNVKNTLGGFSIDGWPIGYVGGNRITNLGSFVVWRDTYQYQGLI